MYKKIMVILIGILILMPIIYSADAPTPQQSQQQAVQTQLAVQQFTVVVQKENKVLADNINSNMDNNFKTIDTRLNDMLKTFLRKLILGTLGGMAVLCVGYAWLVNKITRKYTTTYQKNLWKTKVTKGVKQGNFQVEKTEQPKPEAKMTMNSPTQLYPESINNPFYQPLHRTDNIGVNLNKEQKANTFSENSMKASEPPKFTDEDEKRKRQIKYTILILVVLILGLIAFLLNKYGVVQYLYSFQHNVSLNST